MISNLTGLPLFDWLMRGRGDVVAFPADRRTRLVRETAARLLVEESADALADGFQIVKLGLDAAKLDENETWRQVWAFHEAVQAELGRMGPRHVQGDYPPLPARFS